MRKRNFALCPEGGPVIFLCTVCTLVFAVMEWEILAVAALLLLFFSLNFFRDPERVVPDKKAIAVSPADGKVVRVGSGIDPLSGEERTVICVFMNVFDVHVNRSPVAGTVQGFEYVPGKFLNASLDKASKDNERCAMQIRDEAGDFWTVVQIAGLVARRIVVWTDKDDELSRGERFGMIKFGSRLDLYLPSGYLPCVELGAKVLAGQSVLAKYQD